ncbi:hypothetical protein [Mucilaginibacter polytrichastri]|nr:hypothetical protein [Mucilaginibacter polytrichastri]
MPEGQQSFPHELKQKIYIIKDKIALGLAGNVYQATMYLKDIKNFFNYYTPTEENFKKFMDDYDKEEINACSIVVFIVEETDDKLKPSIHHYGIWEEYNDPLVECGLITGTGKNAFFKKLRQLNSGVNKDDSSRTINLTLLSLFMAEEKYTMDSIVDSWGAGFEIIEYANGKFKKMDDLTYIICQSELDKTGKALINNPFLIMHYTYHGDALTINTYLEGKFRRYGVLPLDIKREEIDSLVIPEYKGFQSSQVLCTFVIEKEDGDLFLASVLTNPNDGYDAINAKFEPPAPAYVQVGITEFISEQVLSWYNQSLQS